MHELAMTENVLNTALRYANSAQAVRVTDVYFVVGQLSSIADDSVQFYWDTISPGTLCQGALLHFEHVPAALKCLNCGNTFALPDDRIACPDCDSERVQVMSGDEFRLDSIQVDTAQAVTRSAIGELIEDIHG